MAEPKPYRRLDAAQLVSSLTQLDARIRDRFPNAGLARVCQDLMTIARENTSRAAAIEKRDGWLWTGIAALIALAIAGLVQLLRLVDFSKTSADSVYTLVQGIDAMIHLVFVMGGLIFFLITMEDRLKRRRALKALNELRSIIHVIDMHQLTKEPASILVGGAPTQHSPKRTLTPFELGRYLDYCSEMLSLVAKVAVLYAQSQPDPVIVDAVSDIERLTTNLSQKIWQKIMLVHTGPGGYAPTFSPAVDGEET
jgi:hypothetical protein